MTYARRYEVLAVLGIHPAGEDDDAAAAQPRCPSGSGARAVVRTGARARAPGPAHRRAPLSERTDEALRDLVAAPPSAKLGQYAQGHLDRRAAEEAAAREPGEGQASLDAADAETGQAESYGGD